MNSVGQTPTARITFGPMQVDWETRIDFDKLRRDRLARTQDAMTKAGLDYLILSRYENCRYTTSVKRIYWPTIHLGGGPNVILQPEGPPHLMIMDPGFAARALTWIPEDHFGPVFEMDAKHEVEAFADELRRRFGPQFERARIGYDIFTPAMYEVLTRRFPNAAFVDGQEVMTNARVIKTPEEIACLKMGYVISEAGLQAALDILKPGVRECELVGAAFKKFWELGAETSQCSECVNSGPGTFPYRRFHTDRIIQAGEVVNIDLGACWNGYFGDFCRPFVCGPHPSRAQRDLILRAHATQMEAIQNLRPGISAAEICQKLGRKGMGHGIGISAFEVPTLRGTDTNVLQPGMVFCVTTPMTLGTPATGGVHIEDQIVITEAGCEVYSTYPYTYVND